MAESTLQTGERQSGGGFRIRPVYVIAGLIAIVLLVLLVQDILLLFSGGGLIYTVSDAVLKFVFNPSQRVSPEQIVVCSTDSTCSTIHGFVYSAILLFVVITGFAYTTLLERRFIAWFQHRVGPNRVGPLGLLQPLADAIKLITKEDIVPSGASKAVWFLAPVIKVVPVLIVLAVIPLGPDLLIPWFDGKWYQIHLYLADPNVGILWLLGITSIGTYGIVLAGWASNNKYAMLGGLRATSQMISYELTLGLGMAVPVMIVGSMALGDIARGQVMIWDWFIFQNPLAAAVLFIALLAEVSRAPFDLVEAEQELTAGFMTEYSGMKFALFMMAEYLGMIAISMILATLYLGGYQDGFGLVNSVPILGPLVLIGKVVLLLIFMVWIRATLPRIRYDQLMQFGWKVLLPLALVAVCWSAIALVIGDVFGDPIAYAVAAGVLFALLAVGGIVYLRRLGKDEEPADELIDDPIVTGERKGIGWGLLNVVGALLAIPFALVRLLTDQLEKIAEAGGVKVSQAEQPVPPRGLGLPVVERRRAPALAAPKAAAPAAKKAAPAEKPALAAAVPAAPAAEAKPAGGGKAKFDKQAMLAKIREKKESKGG
jgi:NADH-quinone oxidoreductase subunit H